MSEELLQKQLVDNPEKIWRWDFYNIWATTLKSLKENKIIPDIDYKHLIRKKPDALLVNKQKVIAIIEHKTPAQFKTELQKKKTINQELEVAKAIKARVYVVTDTKNTLWINPLTWDFITDESWNKLTYNFDHKDPSIEKLIQKILDSISDKNSQIKPRELIDPTPLAKQIWQDIRSVSWATPENCLYTFVEFFIFKYLSDLGVLTWMHSFDELIKMYETNTEKEVLEYYVSQIRKKIKTDLFPKGHDWTTIINWTIFVSKDDTAVEWYSAVFKKILERFAKYPKLEYIDHDFKSKLFESFLKESISKKNRWQFFTPLKVVKSIVKMAEIKEWMVIWDPACGVWKFLLEPVLDQLHKFYKVDSNNKLHSNITLIGYDKWFDKDEQKTIILAKANMLIYFSDLIKENPLITKEFAELFNETFTLKTNSILWTLRDKEEDKYDIIFTNPPYVTSWSSNLKEEIKKVWLEHYYTTWWQGVEWLFIEWIIKSLKAWWQAFIVVPDWFLIRQWDKHLRKYLLDECYLDAIISLPLNTFFTTSKKTYIIAITKKHDKQTERQTDSVFTYLVSEIGETLDIYRFDDWANHLESAVDLYNQFSWLQRWRRNIFEKMNTDLRCKLQPLENFDPDWNRSIDRWRSKDEKVKLWIEENKNTMTINELSNFIGQISEDLKWHQVLLNELGEKKKSNNFKIVKIIDILESPATNSWLKKTDVFLDKKWDNFLPVYSASQDENAIFGWVEDNGKWKSYQNVLTWNKDWSSWIVFYRKNKFVPYEKVKILKIRNWLEATLSYEFLQFTIENALMAQWFGFTFKCSMERVLNVEISIPIDKDWFFDKKKQQELLLDSQVIKDLKQQLLEHYNTIKTIQIEIEEEKWELKTIKIRDLFSIEKWKAEYTNTYIKNHRWDYPVYSSQTTNDWEIWKINKYDFDCECITWTTDWIHAWTLFLRNWKFSMTTHCWWLIPKQIEGLSLKYMFYTLKQNLKEFAVGNMNKRLTKDIMQKVEIKVPIKNDWSFDFKRQEDIVRKYETIEIIRQQILEKLEQVKNISISIE